MGCMRLSLRNLSSLGKRWSPSRPMHSLRNMYWHKYFWSHLENPDVERRQRTKNPPCSSLKMTQKELRNLAMAFVRDEMPSISKLHWTCSRSFQTMTKDDSLMSKLKTSFIQITTTSTSRIISWTSWLERSLCLWNPFPIPLSPLNRYLLQHELQNPDGV